MTQALEKVLVDGHTYEFPKFGAKQSLKILTRLTKIVGEPLAIAAGSAASGGSFFEKDIAPDLMGKAVKALTERLDEDNVIALLEEITSTFAFCDGKKIIFDKHYEGRLEHMFKVFKAGLEVQYGNFFKEFLGNLGDRPKKATTQEEQT